MPNTWLEVDLDVIEANTQAVRALIGGGVQLFAVVKADGFGHGAPPVARAALRGGASALAVAYLDEALRLRGEGITSRIIVLTPGPTDGIRAAQNQRLEVVLGDPEHARAVGEVAARTPVALRVHAKVDTGLGRYGVLAEQFPELLQQIAGQPALRLVGVCSHTARGADPGETQKQLTQFLQAASAAPSGIARHFANSAATATLPAARLEAVRVGAFLYGLTLGLPSELLPAVRPALAWRARLVHVKRIPTGHPVGYGSLFRAERETTVGLVAVGYAHGYPYQLSNKSVAIAGGRRVPVIGSVCMDMLSLDLTDVPPAKVGDTVTLLGAQGAVHITAEELAEKAQTIPYDIVTGLPSHLRREYTGKAAAR